MKLFEKLAALLFLLLLIGIIAFLTFVPVPTTSEQVILIVIGGLMTSAAQALPKLFGVEDSEKEQMKERLRKLENEYAVLKAEYDRLTRELISHHVLHDAASTPRGQIEGPR